MCLLVKPFGGGSRRLIKHPCELEVEVDFIHSLDKKGKAE